MKHPPLTVEQQRDLVGEAVQLLGGIRPAAAAIGVSDRSMGRFLSGQLRIHDHTLEKIATALIAHADKCRAMERRLSPAFTENRTEAQAAPPLHNGNADKRAAPIDPATIEHAKRRLGLMPARKD